MNKIIFFLSLLFFAHHVFAENNNTNIDTGQHSLWFFDQSYLSGFDLATLKDTHVAASPETLRYLKALTAGAVYQINAKEIIFDGVCPKGYMDDSYCIYWGSLENNHYHFLSAGELTAYFHDTHEVFYLKNHFKLINYLTVATAENGKLHDPHSIIESFSTGQNVIRIDQTHFVIDDIEHPGTTYLYHFPTQSLTKLKLPFCYARLWVSAENKLLCNTATHQFFLTPIDGSGAAKNINLKDSSVSIINYDAEKNEMLISRMIFSLHGPETPSLWSFNFNTNKEKFIKYLI